jgi:hypothetical protein
MQLCHPEILIKKFNEKPGKIKVHKTPVEA